MSDRFAATIEIGGNITPAKLKGLFDVCESEGVVFNSDESKWYSFEDFSLKLFNGTTVTFRHDQACYGMFNELEQFCKDNDLSCERRSEGYYEYSPSMSWWVPGMKEARDVVTDNDGEVVLCAQDILGMLKKGTAEQKVARLKAKIKSLSPPTIPPLMIVELKRRKGRK